MTPELEQHAIEKAYPEAYRLARKFHEVYEEMAPHFGYETRKDTKAFDPASPNGRLMANVCWTVVEEELEKAREYAYEKGIKAGLLMALEGVREWGEREAMPKDAGWEREQKTIRLTDLSTFITQEIDKIK